MNDELWLKIVKVHGHAKALILRAEELDQEHEFVLSPVMQQRDAHAHCMRARVALLGLRGPGDSPDPSYCCEETRFESEQEKDDYVRTNLDRALGHEYRAFFDAADWLAIVLRERLHHALDPFPHESISSVIPEFYSEILPRLDQADREIAAIRNRKDVGSGKDILLEVEQYSKVLKSLDQDYERVIAAKAGVAKDATDRKRGSRMRLTLRVLAAAALAAISALAGAQMTAALN